MQKITTILIKWKKRSFIQKAYAFLRYLISKFVIQNADHFLTVGEYSLNMFREKYKILADNSYNICGPIDEQIINYDEFSLGRDICKSSIVKSFLYLQKN